MKEHFIILRALVESLAAGEWDTYNPDTTSCDSTLLTLLLEHLCEPWEGHGNRWDVLRFAVKVATDYHDLEGDVTDTRTLFEVGITKEQGLALLDGDLDVTVWQVQHGNVYACRKCVDNRQPWEWVQVPVGRRFCDAHG